MPKVAQIFVIVAVFCVVPILARGEEKPRIVLNLTVEKEVVAKDEKGRAVTAWQEVKAIEPGELLRYTITYRNDGKHEARNVAIIDPIPAGTVYLANGAEGKNAEITFSLDGAGFQVPPLLKYTAPGSRQELTATPEMYTHVRWRITRPVPPGGTGTVSFKVKAK